MRPAILVAIDLAHVEEEHEVLSQAARLAALDEALLCVVTVIPDYGMSIVSDYFEKGAEQKALERARNRLHTFTASTLGEDAQVKHVVTNGNVYEGVLKAAKAVDATLIVIGAHKPGFGDYLLGPNAARVVRHSECSVFVVRH